MKRKSVANEGVAAKSGWVSPKLRYLGRVADVINMPGGGKTSTKQSDTGDLPLKPPGQSMMDT